MRIIRPQLHVQVFFNLLQIHAKQPVFLRIVVYAKDTDNKLSITLFQTVHNNIVRYHFIVNINIR